MMKEIDAEYYGYLDDEDYLLLEQEAKCEREARQKKIDEFKAQPLNQQMVINEIELVEVANPNDLNVKIFE
jgi:hypothetical protein